MKRIIVLSLLLIASIAYAGFTSGEFVTDAKGKVTSFFFPDKTQLHQKRAERIAPFSNLSVNQAGNKATAMQVACFEHYTSGAQVIKGTANCTMMVDGVYGMDIRAGENHTLGIPHNWSYIQFRKYSTADNLQTTVKARVWIQR
jgi:hypothetical protein